MISVSTRVIRLLAGDTAAIFNDPLKNKRRSYKVLGWGKPDYKKAQKLLEQFGVKSEIVLTQRYYRIHVG